jgi:cytochrome b subunit of formate dehydrogenase
MLARLILVAFATILLGANAIAGAEQEPSVTEVCLGCHATEGFAGPENESLFVDGARYAVSAHNGLDCTGCHSDATPGHGKLKRVGLDDCATCHDEAVAAYRKSVHGKASAQGIKEAATCVDCHGNIHTLKSVADATSSAHWTHQATTCARCHADTAMVEKFGIPVTRPVDAYLKSVHARVVTDGRHGATCADCHGAHDVLPSNDPQSTVWHARVPETCGHCHSEILAQFKESVHGVGLARGNSGVPVCTDCHGEHRIQATSEPSSPVFAANIPGETCGRCHGDTRLVEKYGLGRGNVSAFADSFHGLALRSGRLSVANCASCHGVHDIHPSSDPRSSVHAANLPTTCGKCHPGAGQTFALGTVHRAADSFGGLLVGWIRGIYLWLIGIVIGGMVVHNSLDWLRKARYPEPAAPPPSDDQPERMPRVMRLQHGMMMLSFPLLVYSGFALSYPEAWWAAPLLRWENGVGLRGLIHRIAALLMTTGFVWHAIYVVVKPRRRVYLFALLPKTRDIRAFLGTLAWYFGRRAHRPRSGQFNYAEKAEYWAFVWGTMVMCLTGAMLWFENFTLQLLPSWVPDAVTALHFYEAVLATLAILVWHLYWVIFDPEVYPMDWSWLTGKSPASRVHERETPTAQDDQNDDS